MDGYRASAQYLTTAHVRRLGVPLFGTVLVFEHTGGRGDRYEKCRSWVAWQQKNHPWLSTQLLTELLPGA